MELAKLVMIAATALAGFAAGAQAEDFYKGKTLTIVVGYSPGGSLLRHPLEFNRLLDIWSSFGLPLWLSLCAPSSAIEDPLAQHKATVSPGIWSPAAQDAWAARFVPLALVNILITAVVLWMKS